MHDIKSEINQNPNSQGVAAATYVNQKEN